jgi:RND family efflux transporter MFP subunit
VGWWIQVGASIVALVLVMMALAGAFHKKASPQLSSSAIDVRPGAAQESVVVLETLPKIEWATGTIQAVRETSLGSKLLAKVVEVRVRAGDAVGVGDVLIRLDDAELLARVAQAKSALSAAQARRQQAQTDYDRVMTLSKQGAAAEHEISQATHTLDAARATVDQSQHALDESQTLLSYATITAPFSGLVVDKQVDVGDTVTPGQIVAKLYDPTHMQLVANVRESLAAKLHVGQTVEGTIPAMDKACRGAVAEIVPQTQAMSRTFDVKVVGPCAPGIYSGMFARLEIPVGEESVLLVPVSAIRSVGQLATVRVAAGDRYVARSVQIGRTFGDRVEVLSGLRAGETVALEASQSATTMPSVK